MRKRKTMLHNSAWRIMLLLGWIVSLTAPAAWARQDGPPPAPEPAIITGHVGDIIQVGAASWDPPPGEHWELVSHPDGSQAVLRRNPWQPGLRLQPDVEGIYVVDDEDAGGAVLNETRIEIGTAGTSTPVQTRVVSNSGSQSNDYSIVVNGKSYPAQAGLPRNGVMILALDRKSLAVKAQRTVGAMSEAKTYLQGLLNQKLDALYIISSLQTVGGPVSTIAPELQRLGANQEFAGITYRNFSFTFVGSQSWHSGQAYQAGSPGPGGLAGSLVRDAGENYTFLQNDYTRFTLQPTTTGPASVQIGNSPMIQSTPKSGALGGFLLAVFDRASLEVKTSDTYYTFSNTYDTTSEIQRLVKDLQAYQGNEEVLLALVSFGQPYQGFDSLFATVARAVSNLGGTYEAVYDLNRQDTYALLISSNPPAELGLPRFPIAEAGSKVSSNAATGALTGILARGRRGNWYAPVADTTANTNLELYSILAQTPVPFPHPAPGQAGEQKAYEYISGKLCIGVSPANCSDLRTNYGNGNFDVRTRLSNLLTLKDQDNPNIDCDHTTLQTDFCTVRNQLRDELVYAGDIRSLNTNLGSLWTDYQTSVGLSLTTTEALFKKQLRLDWSRRAEPVIPPAVSTFFRIASFVPGGVGAAAGMVTGALLFTSFMTNRTDGSSLVFDVETKVGDLAEQAKEAFVQQLKARGVMFRCIYEDWGKLQALGQALQSGQAGWFWDDNVKADLLTELNSAYEISTYRSLLSSLYVRRIWNAQRSQVKVPDDYKFIEIILRVPYEYSIFRHWKDRPDGFLASPSPRADGGGPQLDLLMLTEAGDATGRGPFDRFTYEKAPDAILQKIFGPKGLGVPKPQIYRQWPFHTFYCSRPGAELLYPNSSYVPSNCDFTTPQLPQ